ncbi:hypothetical protein PRIPAC_81708 [Pristionchus pacificus]|uniref:Uncharacterized protein n=1 Tax=Pristionchus pacificus TaxID=54126 RepID=A0A454XZM4_PRIPA|nr:hypothetical protein PRIPAC_81708 [Pristionchus pacificus]|eukprot:PDM65586.1 hypothetical protein PRIPAC_52528 [Pristionchus pacificus]
MREVRSLLVLLLVATSLHAGGPRLIEFVNNCASQVQVWRQAGLLTGASSEAYLESGQRFTGNYSIGLLPTSFTNGVDGLTQVTFRSFLIDRFELDVSRGFDIAMKVEARAEDSVLVCKDANCAGESTSMVGFVGEVPYNGNFTITFCP